MEKQTNISNMAEYKNFSQPDEVREFPKGILELIRIGGAIIGRGIFEPGWRWATSVQPIAKTHSCEAPHFQYHVSGILLPPGHDAWTVGDEPAVVIDFQGMVDYAKHL